MKNTLFLSFLAFSLMCFTLEGQVSGQGKITHDGYDTMAGEYYGLMFEATNSFTLLDVEVWSLGPGGKLEIVLQDRDGTVLEYASRNIPTNRTDKPIPTIVRLGWTIYPGQNYRLLAFSDPNLAYDHLPSVGGAYAYPIGSVGRVNSGFTKEGIDNDHYYYFYNWTIEY